MSTQHICRHCGCSELAPCVYLSDEWRQSGFHEISLEGVGTCAWATEAQDVCTAPACVEAEFLRLCEEAVREDFKRREPLRRELLQL